MAASHDLTAPTGVTPLPAFSDQARGAIFSQLGPALSALKDLPQAARWPLVEALLAFLPPVSAHDAQRPLLTMGAHLDALGRVLRGEPDSPYVPAAPQAAARAHLQRLRGPGVLDMPLQTLLPAVRDMDEQLDLREMEVELARSRHTPEAYRMTALGVTIYALREGERASDALYAERGVRIPPQSGTLGDLAEVGRRPLKNRELEALRLLERVVLTLDAQERQETDWVTWWGLARAALRAGQSSSPLPWPW
ncbi:hypothetical protein [Deinococcus sp.]|uniref:hypothetical protein n=1 Tax=Deinococcus sp. TaxID=47478 RepID=UPI0025C0638F|nr:hypothetical protein [Deinococcus sp.]